MATPTIELVASAAFRRQMIEDVKAGSVLERFARAGAMRTFFVMDDWDHMAALVREAVEKADGKRPDPD